MSTYTNEIKAHNEWGNTIIGIWIRYGKSGTSRYFDCNNISLLGGSDLPIGTISTESGDPDNWTVSFIDDQNRLWGTEQFITANVPHQNSTIEISLVNTEVAPDYYQARFIMPDGESKVFTIYRL